MPELRQSAPIILASTSATRRALCASAGLQVDCHAPQVDEAALAAAAPDLPPAKLAQRLAEAKALDVSTRHPKAYVIGGDQVCALGETIFGKSGNAEAALRQLRQLQGAWHAQHSGYALARNGRLLTSGTVSAELRMRAWNEEDLLAYIAKEEPFASAGSYKFEGMGRLLFAEVRGTQDVILGLALQPLLDALVADGIIAF